MPLAPSNGIEICYDEFGSTDDDPLVLVRGWASQMIAWRPPFCEKLAAQGFRVIRFDNRDVGLSTKPDADYTVDAFAADTVGLMDHLGMASAHLVGMSMGGMIAQVVAIEYPERVRSLVSIMSHMGGTDVVPPAERAAVLLTPRPDATTREEAIERGVEERRAITGRGFPFDEDDVRAVAAESYDRCYYPEGRARQLRAVLGAPSRQEALAKLTIPITVVHGNDDPLVRVENGRAMAEALPRAEFVEIDGMGHDIPAWAYDAVIDAIVSTARRAA
jgi:pimeloyl-ACP methyl ester carboxylesterase